MSALRSSFLEDSLRFLGPDPENWVPAQDGVDHDVAIIGAGQSGVSMAFALRRAGIGNVTVIDAAAEGDEGIWVNRAHMNGLRTPKLNLGPELGIPTLAFQAWFEERWGRDAFEDLKSIRRTDWADYLRWLRQVLNIRPRWETSLIAVEPDGERLRLVLRRNGEETVEVVRKLVLATGIVGAGARNIPSLVSDALPSDRYAHSYSTLPQEKFSGARIAVLGAASSAFDVAATALEAGAKEVHLFCRREDLARSSPLKNSGFAGFEFFFHLPDELKWRYVGAARARGPFPTPPVVARATRFENFHLHLASPWDAVSFQDGEIRIRAGGRDFSFDFVLLGTGFITDLSLRPELSRVASAIATWGDRYPSWIESDPALSRFPYLSAGYELTEKHPGKAPCLRNIYCFNLAAQLSFGRLHGDVASLRAGIPRVVQAIASSFFTVDQEHHLARLSAPVAADLDREIYARSLRSAPIPANA